MSGSPITTHILDTARGVPARGVPVFLEERDGSDPSGNTWTRIASGHTDDDGRLRTLLPDGYALSPGIYRLIFDTGTYFAATDEPTAFYPHVEIHFHVRDAAQHYHVPLLLSPFGYSTYRGS